jgi:hypothetical protein
VELSSKDGIKILMHKINDGIPKEESSSVGTRAR